MKARFNLLFAALLGVAACDAPVSTTIADRDVAMTPVTWKENTPRIVRLYDINECETLGRGVAPNASPDEIAAATAAMDPKQIAANVTLCLQDKGYLVTEKPVCQPDDFARGEFQSGVDVLPPLDSVVCMDPVNRGFVTTI